MKLSTCYPFLLGNERLSLCSRLSNMGQSKGGVSSSRYEGFQRTAKKCLQMKAFFKEKCRECPDSMVQCFREWYMNKVI